MIDTTRLDRLQNEKVPSVADVAPASKLPRKLPVPATRTTVQTVQTGQTRRASNIIQRMIQARRH